jgi:hypothetical protein
MYGSPFILGLPHNCSILYTSHLRDNMMTPFVLLLAVLSAPIAALVSRDDGTCSVIPQCPDEDGCTTTTANGAKFQLHCSTDFSGPSIATTQVRSITRYPASSRSLILYQGWNIPRLLQCLFDAHWLHGLQPQRRLLLSPWCQLWNCSSIVSSNSIPCKARIVLTYLTEATWLVES